MTATDLIHTPWGWSQDIEELAQGVWRVSTAGHGGLNSAGSGGTRCQIWRGTASSTRTSLKRTARNSSPGPSWASATTGNGNWP